MTIKNFGSGTPKLNEGIIVSGSAGDDTYSVVVTGSVCFQGDITTDEYIFHRGDTDTYIRLEDDEINIEVGGRQMIKMVEAATDKITINNGGNDVDLQVKGENEANLIRTDAGNDRVGIVTSSPGSGLHVNSSFATALTVKSSDYTATDSDHTILVDCSNGNVNITLPSAVGSVGRIYVIKRIDGTNNAANINSNGSEEIEGSTNPASVTSMSSIMIQSDNLGWWKVAEYILPP